MINQAHSRRMFLRGLGGFALPIPFLSSLVSRSAAAASSASLIRYVQLTSQNGVNPEDFFPSFGADVKISESAAYRLLTSTGTQDISRNLGRPFTALKSKINIIKGLDIQLPGSGDLFHSRTTMSTASSQDRSYEGEKGFPYSIDMVLGASNSFNPVPSLMPEGALRLGVGSSDQSPSIYGRQRPEYYLDPSALLNSLNRIGSGTNVTDPKLIARNNRAVTTIDLVMEDYKRIANSRKLASQERTNLENFIELSHTTQKRIQLMSLNRTAGKCGGVEIHSGNSTLTYQTYFDLITMAFACGASKIASVVVEPKDPEFRFSNAQHGQVHAMVARWRASRDWVYARQADLITSLDRLTDSDGRSLLYNSVVLSCPNMAKPSHGLDNMPVLMAGNAGGSLKTGYYLDLKGRYNDVLITVFKALGVPPSEYEKYGSGKGFGAYVDSGSRNTTLPVIV